MGDEPTLKQRLTKTAGDWADNRLAGEAVMVAKQIEQHNLLGRLARKTMDGTLGQRTEEPEGDEVQVNVGNQYHVATPSQSGSTIGSVAKKAAIAAALLGAGGAAGLVPYVAGLLRQEQPATVLPAEVIDTNTEYELSIEQ